MKKITLLLLVLLISSCRLKEGKKVYHSCIVTSCEIQKKISVLDEINRTKYIIKTSCGRNFIVHREYNVGDIVAVNEVIMED